MNGGITTQFVADVIVIGTFLIAALALGATTMRRRTP
jgi:hypothetical protein